MKIAVHSGSGFFHEKWCEFLKTYCVDVLRVNLLASDIYNNIATCDGVMWHLSMNPSVLQAAEPILWPIENVMCKNVFPDHKTRWHFENKFAQKYLFESIGVRTPATYCFWKEADAREWIDTGAQFPLVQKKARGAGSVAVALVKDKQQAHRIVSRSFSPYGTWHQVGYYSSHSKAYKKRVVIHVANFVIRLKDALMHVITGRMPHLPNQFWMPEKDCVLFQEYIPGNAHDTRVTVVGNRAFAFRRWNRDGDFRASGSGKLDFDAKGIDTRMVEKAFEISKAGSFQSMAYDFLLSVESIPIVCEMSFGYQNTAVHSCPGHWDRSMKWHEGNMWPESAHVKDIIDSIHNKHMLK